MTVNYDYKPDDTWKSRRRLRLHGLMVLTLVAVGLFGSLLAYISSHYRVAEMPAPGAAAPAPPAAVVPGLAALPPVPPPAPPKYDFYKVLPERRLEIPELQSAPKAVQKPAATATRDAGRDTGRSSKPKAAAGDTRSKGRSSADRAAAEQQKSQLTTKGIKARAKTVTGDDGNKQYQVRVNPARGSKSKETAEKTRGTAEKPRQTGTKAPTATKPKQGTAE